MKKQTISGLFKMTLTAGFVLAFLFIPTGAFAASLIHWNDGDTYVSIEDGETYSIPIGVEGDVYISTDEPVFSIEGTVFFLQNPNDSNSREYIDTIFASFPEFPDLFTWPQAGVYEIDVYESAPPVLSSKSWFEKLVRIIFGSNVYAQDPNLYLGTIHFTIEDSNEPQYQECCSSVIFLPGIMGTRLYEGSEKRWEPDDGEVDVQALYLNNQGKSIKTITTGGVIETFDHPIFDPDIYKSFISDLDAASSAGTISGYAVVPYDWRLSIPDILADGSIEQTLRNIAEGSQTGKVSIIAHSNGGLVGKALINALAEEAPELVDYLILVGVPQIGTPQAIGALLHGFDAGIDFTFSDTRARDFAKNAPMSYQLLPHVDYQNNNSFTLLDPLVTFLPGLGTEPFISQYGSFIETGNELYDFINGADGRTQPDYFDLESPAVGNTLLLSNAETLMQSIGSTWTPPDGIVVHQIAGVGENTLVGITYKPSTRCVERYVSPNSTPTCLSYEPSVIYTPEEVRDGDGTVVLPSALAMSAIAENVNRWWVDLGEYNKDELSIFSGVNFLRTKHANILEINQLRSFVFDNFITKTSNLLPKYISDSTVSLGEDNRLRFILHSPLALSATDNLGNEISETASTIPGATYKRYGEVQVVWVPQESLPTLHLTGEAEGSFTLEVEEYNQDVLTATTSFSTILSSTSTTAYMELPEGTIASASELFVDYDGNGSVDFFSKSDSYGRTLTDMVVDIREVVSGMQVVRSSQSFKLTTYRNQINAQLDTIEQRYLNFLISEQNEDLFLSVLNLENYINSISSGIARIRWTDSNKLKTLLAEMKEEIDYVEPPQDPTDGDGEEQGSDQGSINTGEYYKDPDRWEVAL